MLWENHCHWSRPATAWATASGVCIRRRLGSASTRTKSSAALAIRLTKSLSFGRLQQYERPERPDCRKCRALVEHVDHRHPPRRNRYSRLSDPGVDRRHLLPADDLADGPRPAPERGAGKAPRGGARRVGRSWAARTVDRDLAHVDYLRSRTQQR